jgi:hypothetical protein
LKSLQRSFVVRIVTGPLFKLMAGEEIAQGTEIKSTLRDAAIEDATFIGPPLFSRARTTTFAFDTREIYISTTPVFKFLRSP